MGAVATELAHVELFAGLDAASLRHLADRAFSRRLAKGQILFSEGEPTSHLFIVRSGHLRIFVSSPDGDDLVLTVVGPGESVGDATVLSGEARSASVDAIEATELVAVPADDIRAVLRANPEVLLALAARLAATVRRVTGTAADLVFLDVPRRLAKLLVDEAVEQRDGSAVCELNMSQSGVAARIGATRQSLNRALGEFSKRGWISTDGTAVRLDNREALTRFARS
jgi:CRP-like cAMP-binding protein